MKGRVVRTNAKADISVLRVDERQFRVLPRTLELSGTAPIEGQYVIVCGAHASAPGFPRSVNNGIRILRVGRQVGPNRWELNDSSHSGHSGGVIVSASTGKVLGTMSSTNSLGIATFGAVGGLGYKFSFGTKPEASHPKPNYSFDSTELILVTQDRCKPCDAMKSQLKRLGISYNVTDFRKAKQMAMNIQSTPSLIAFNGSHPTAYLVGGAYTDSQVIDWINQFAKH